MTGVTGLTLDGRYYRILIVYDSLKRSFELKEGQNSAESITGRPIRDILGTGYTYSISVKADPEFPNDYDDFYYAISAPVEYHSVSLPFGQGVITFDAMIESGSDVYKGVSGAYQTWDELDLTFKPMDLQRTGDEVL